MDQGILVTSGHILVRALDAAGIPPSAAVWVHNTDTDTWKLWLVPHESIKDQREFYRRLVEVVAEHRDELGGIDAADAQMVKDTHPAIEGLRKLMKMTGLGAAHLSNNLFNGYYLPDGIVLRTVPPASPGGQAPAASPHPSP